MQCVVQMVRMEWIVENVLEVGLSHVVAMASVWSVCPELCLAFRHCILTVFYGTLTSVLWFGANLAFCMVITVVCSVCD